jgi:hypothetical protein
MEFSLVLVLAILIFDTSSGPFITDFRNSEAAILKS